jgi:hypothetical protein
MLSHLVALLYAKKSNGDATEQNISYFLSFDDPTQPEKEVGSILVAMILTGLKEMKKAGWVDATPSQVVKYMRDGAEQSPQDMHLYLQFK